MDTNPETDTENITILVIPSDKPAYLTKHPFGDTEAKQRKQAAFFHSIVGGYLEGIRLSDDSFMYVNEDGDRLGLLPNPNATRLVSTLSPATRMPAAGILGDALVVGTNSLASEYDVSVGQTALRTIQDITGYEPR